ncbi:hypothetical protein CMUS01_11889 [Colletotrichum musicola]|uniref:Uncharacterized protein n=1 Tax=Colletotrichum musicola TaxID=2175873 RepID=A0A8H6N3V6_9PEZI|nr:hypothetical protein CMUS01_11889 [Colletotrichum musicola]
MPPSPSLLAKCSSTIWCSLRNLPLWAVVLLVLLLGAIRQLVLPSRRPTTTVADKNKNKKKRSPSPDASSPIEQRTKR